MSASLPPIPKNLVTKPWKDAVLRHVLPRYQIKHELAQQDVREQIVLSGCVLSHDEKILFVKNAKVASTTTIGHMVRNMTGEMPENPLMVKTGIKQGPVHWKAYRAAMAEPNCLKLSFLRDPIDRIVSAYFNFFVDLKNKGRRRHLAAIRARGLKAGGDLYQNFLVFLDYVEESHELSEVYCDPHWRPQHVNIGVGLVDHDYIGRLETYGADLKAAFERAGYDTSGIDTERRLNKSSNKEFNVAPAERQRLERLFARDYEYLEALPGN